MVLSVERNSNRPVLSQRKKKKEEGEDEEERNKKNKNLTECNEKQHSKLYHGFQKYWQFDSLASS